MCFTQTMSWVFTVLGFGGAAFIYRYIPSMYFIAHTIFYFAWMELLQALTYPYLDQCDNWWNKVLTFIGMVHVCFQPLVTNFMAANEVKNNPVHYERFMFACRLSILFGFWMMARVLFEMFGITKSSVSDECKYTYNSESLRGTNLCSYTGHVHMGWHYPMADNHYFWPSINLHAFLSFGPFAVHPEEPVMIFKCIMLILTGPLFAMYLTPDNSEVAAVWCLYSVGHLLTAGLLHFFFVNGGKFDEVAAGEEKKKKLT